MGNTENFPENTGIYQTMKKWRTYRKYSKQYMDCTAGLQGARPVCL